MIFASLVDQAGLPVALEKTRERIEKLSESEKRNLAHNINGLLSQQTSDSSPETLQARQFYEQFYPSFM